MSALHILAAHVGDEAAQLSALLDLGFSEPNAHRFVNLMPSGLARVIVESLGAQVADQASIAVGEDQFVSFSLAKQPLYGMAVDLGRAHQERGVLPHEVYRKIVDGTAEIDTIDNLFKAGGDPEGAVIALAFCDPRLADYIVDPSAPKPHLEHKKAAGISQLWKKWWRS